MRRWIALIVAVPLFTLFAYLHTGYGSIKGPIMVFCGAAFKQPMEEVIKLYRDRTGMEVNVTYGGVGTLLSQILLSKRGDILVVPSPDIMERAKEKGVIVLESIKETVYMAPCINTQLGNPKRIQGLKDLARPGIRLGLANPEIVYAGAIAAEIIEKNLSKEEKEAIRDNIVTYVEDFNKLAALLIMKQVDAIIGLNFLKGWYPDKVDTVRLKPNEVIRIGAGKAAIISYTQNRAEAERFIHFLSSEEAKGVFKRYHYFTTPSEAFEWVGAKRPIGGEFTAIKDWIGR